MTQIATLLTLACIAGLFYLDREERVSNAKALWLPVCWLLVVSSRPVSMWLHINREVTLANRYTEGSPVDAAFYGALIGAGLLVLNARWRQVKGLLLANLPVLLFFLYCAVSMTWADSPGIAVKRWIKAVGDLVMVLLIVTDPHPSLALRRVFARVGFVLLPLSALLIWFYPGVGSAYDPNDHVTMYFGVTTFKNLLGVTCMFCGLGALWGFLGVYRDREAWNRRRLLLAYGVTLAMAALLIVKADSMTSLSCFGLAGIVMVLSTTRWAMRPRAALALVSGTVALALFAIFFDAGGSMLHTLGRNSTLTGRTQIWAAVLAQPINPILGTGFESFWMGNRLQSVWDLSQVGIEEAHNGYLEMYLNLGWIGVALLGVLIVTGYRNAVTVFRSHPHAGTLRLALFTASLIYSFTEAGFRMMSPIWIGFLFSILAVPAVPVMQPAGPMQGAIQWPLGRKKVRILQ